MYSSIFKCDLILIEIKCEVSIMSILKSKEILECLCKMYTTNVVLNEVETSPIKEIIDDMVSIVHVFSCRLHSL